MHPCSYSLLVFVVFLPSLTRDGARSPMDMEQGALWSRIKEPTARRRRCRAPGPVLHPPPSPHRAHHRHRLPDARPALNTHILKGESGG